MLLLRLAIEAVLLFILAVLLMTNAVTKLTHCLYTRKTGWCIIDGERRFITTIGVCSYRIARWAVRRLLEALLLALCVVIWWQRSQEMLSEASVEMSYTIHVGRKDGQFVAQAREMMDRIAGL